MASRNDITGDALVSKRTSNSYRDGWGLIFDKKKKESKDVVEEVKVEDTPETVIEIPEEQEEDK